MLPRRETQGMAGGSPTSMVHRLAPSSGSGLALGADVSLWRAPIAYLLVLLTAVFCCEYDILA